ncbi:protein of unknown function [Pararobbsia alpina]
MAQRHRSATSVSGISQQHQQTASIKPLTALKARKTRFKRSPITAYKNPGVATVRQ